MVTRNMADMLGLTDRGRLRKGLRADILRFGEQRLVIAPGSASGRYAVDDQACGLTPEDIAHVRTGIDGEAMKKKFMPEATIELTKETIEWVRARTPLVPKS